MVSKLRDAIYGEIGRLCELEASFNGNLPEHQKRIDNSTDAIISAVIEALPIKKDPNLVESGYENDREWFKIVYQNMILDDIKSILLEAKDNV